MLAEYFDGNKNFKSKMIFLSERNVGELGDIYRRLAKLADHMHESPSAFTLISRFQGEFTDKRGLLIPERIPEFLWALKEAEKEVEAKFGLKKGAESVGLARKQEDSILVDNNKTSIEEGFERVKSKIEYCELQYNMSIKNLGYFVDPELVDTAYFAAINNSLEVLDVVREKISKGENISRPLRDIYDLCNLVLEMLDTKDLFVFNSKNKEVIKAVAALKRDYLSAAKKIS